MPKRYAKRMVIQFKSISVTGTISYLVSKKINKYKKNNERCKIM